MVNNLGFVHMHMKCQSGETADTLAALRMAKEKNIPPMAIVNVVGSSMATWGQVLESWDKSSVKRV